MHFVHQNLSAFQWGSLIATSPFFSVLCPHLPQVLFIYVFIYWVALEFPHFYLTLGQEIVLTATCENCESMSEQ